MDTKVRLLLKVSDTQWGCWCRLPSSPGKSLEVPRSVNPRLASIGRTGAESPRGTGGDRHTGRPASPEHRKQKDYNPASPEYRKHKDYNLAYPEQETQGLQSCQFWTGNTRITILQIRNRKHKEYNPASPEYRKHKDYNPTSPEYRKHKDYNPAYPEQETQGLQSCQFWTGNTRITILPILNRKHKDYNPASPEQETQGLD